MCEQSAWKFPVSSVCSNCASRLLSTWLYAVLGSDKGGKPTRLSNRNEWKSVPSFFCFSSDDICHYLEGKVLNQEVRRNPFMTLRGHFIQEAICEEMLIFIHKFA